MSQKQYTPTEKDTAEMANRFTFHPCTGDEQRERHEQVRGLCKSVADHLLKICPPSRELSVSLLKLEEAMFWGNASISRNEKPPA